MDRHLGNVVLKTSVNCVGLTPRVCSRVYVTWIPSPSPGGDSRLLQAPQANDCGAFLVLLIIICRSIYISVHFLKGSEQVSARVKRLNRRCIHRRHHPHWMAGVWKQL